MKVSPSSSARSLIGRAANETSRILNRPDSLNRASQIPANNNNRWDTTPAVNDQVRLRWITDTDNADHSLADRENRFPKLAGLYGRRYVLLYHQGCGRSKAVSYQLAAEEANSLRLSNKQLPARWL